MLKFFQNAKSLFRLCESKQDIRLHYNHAKEMRALYTSRRFSSDVGEGSELDLTAITQGNAELEHKLKVLILETEVLRQDGVAIPSESYLKTVHWQELLQLGSRSARKKYLIYLFKTEKKKENEEMRKIKRREVREAQVKEEIVTDHLRYDLGYNHIFLRFYDTTINNLYNWKLIEAMQFGQELVVDCGYDQNMTTRENINCAKQLMLLFAGNRANQDPYHLHFCNCNKESALMQSLKRRITTLYEPSFPLNVHEKSYLDIFPKERLVYLTPHCKEEMNTYDHDLVYIIGGIVDKVNSEPFSLAKAKEEGLRMMKLPLDRYLQWGSGSGKSLTLNQMIAILSDMKQTGDWQHALRHVPRRKLVDLSAVSADDDDARSLSYEEDLRMERLRTDNFKLRYNANGKNSQERRGRPKLLRDVRSIFNE